MVALGGPSGDALSKSPWAARNASECRPPIPVEWQLSDGSSGSSRPLCDIRPPKLRATNLTFKTRCKLNRYSVTAHAGTFPPKMGEF